MKDDDDKEDQTKKQFNNTNAKSDIRKKPLMEPATKTEKILANSDRR